MNEGMTADVVERERERQRALREGFWAVFVCPWCVGWGTWSKEFYLTQYYQSFETWEDETMMKTPQPE
jgi:hypothetical protein